MKKAFRYLLWAPFLLMIIPLNAQTLLWQMSKNGKPKGYIFGTMHTSLSETDSLYPQISSCIKACDEYYMEADMNQANALFLLGKAFMSNNTKLSDLISQEDYEMVNESLKRKGYNAGMFDRIQPYFLYGLLSQMDSSDEKVNLDEIIDIRLANKAKEMGVKVKGLESMGEQMESISKIPYNEQAKALVSYLKTEQENPNELDEMLELYQLGNIDSLYQMAANSMSNDEMKYLLIDRNVRMADRIEKYAKKKRIFVAVGAAHLGGVNGVLNLLKQKGFTIGSF